MNNKNIGCHVSDSGEESNFQFPTSNFQQFVTHEEIHARACEEEVEGNEEFHCDVREIGEQKEQKEIRRIEESVLVVGDEGSAGVESGVPQ